MDDKELLDRLRCSDVDAFNSIHAHHWKALYIFAIQKTSNKEDAFDLVQDIFMDTWSRRADIPEINVPLKFYLRGILINKLARYYKVKGFHQKHQKDFEEFLKNEYATHMDDRFVRSSDESRYEELVQIVSETIDHMPHRMKTVFKMSRSGDYSISQIAEKLSISPQTVKNQINHAFVKLREATKDYSLSSAETYLLALLVIS